jgi:hypothetical protein
MEPKKTNIELIPRSIFKGKNSDGTSFTVNEWAPNSIGNAPDMTGCTVIIAGYFFNGNYCTDNLSILAVSKPSSKC